MRNYLKHQIQFVTSHINNWHKQQSHVMEVAKQRVLITACLATAAYFVIGLRLVDVMLLKTKDCSDGHCQVATLMRKNITDRNGEILATQLMTASLYANPKVIINAKEAAKKLCSIFSELKYQQVLSRLQSDKGFVWIMRHITPKVQNQVNNLGIPGVYLQSDQRRVYPHGSLVSHVLGGCNIDGQGIMGIEKEFDKSLAKDQEDIKLSLDIRIQHVVHDELKNGIALFQAIAGNAMVMDIETGEILAMVSLPDFDPNLPNRTESTNAFNRNTLGVYEPGSVFKTINMAIALESGTANLNTVFDASAPIKIGRFVVTDFKGQNRPLTMLEAYIYSSNIACIKIAQKFGNKVQKKFFKKFGLLESIKVEIPENGAPLVPRHSDWQEISTMTMSYGYGISVTPLQTFCTINGLVNDGFKPIPTILAVPRADRQNRIKQIRQNPIVSKQTSQLVRQMMRAVITDGTAKKANVSGYLVFGKTGTAYQAKGGNYGAVKKRTTTFIGGFPLNSPKYMLIVMLDDPKPSTATYGYATAGWNAAPIAGKIIERIATILRIKPVEENQNQLINGAKFISTSLVNND